MALDEKSCDAMVKAAEKSRMILQIGHCLRFWPEYIKLAEMANSGEYGELLVASFKRLSAYPRWSWNNWLMKEHCSGGALLDLHIHDSDFIQYLFGMPKSVNCKGIKGPSGGFDHVLTDFNYGDKKIINAEASWMMPKSFGFEMGFTVMFEKATVIFSSRQSPTLQVFPADGEIFSPGISDVSGHLGEIKNFLDKIKGLDVPAVITPRQSLNSVRIVLAERESAKTSREVVVL
jgi:predicted dehydrogenase